MLHLYLGCLITDLFICLHIHNVQTCCLLATCLYTSAWCCMACDKGAGFPVLGSGGLAVSEWDAFGRVGVSRKIHS